MARSYHATAGVGAPAATLINGASDFLGINATSAEAAAYFIKLYWTGNSNAVPVVGTTLPKVTLAVPVTGLNVSLNFPLNNGGLLYWTATANAADTDTTGLTGGGDVITIIYD